MPTPLETIPVKTLKGEDSNLAAYEGRVRLVVNTASKCGLTPQFEGLEALHKAFWDDGFTVLGFPSNDFAGQEPLADDEILQFCVDTYHTTFPMYSKIRVVGKDKHPLYEALTTARPKTDTPDTSMRATLAKFGMTPSEPPELLWNFEKFLISRDGEVIGRYPPDMDPKDPEFLKIVKDAL